MTIILADKTNILGCDECGTGALAYSLVVSGVKAPKNWTLEGLNDSKKLTPKRRETMRVKLQQLIDKGEIIWHLAERFHFQIDKFGLAATLKDAYVEVFHKLYDIDCLIIVDGTLKFDNLGVDDYSKISIIKADTQFSTVMAASILGKTYRDAKMRELHLQYPMYNWISNMGYPRPEHLQAISDFGPCELHRMSYAPMKNQIVKSNNRQLEMFKK